MDNADPLCFARASIADSGLKYSSPLLVTPWCTTNEGQAFSCQQGALRTAWRLTSYFATQMHWLALSPDVHLLTQAWHSTYATYNCSMKKWPKNYNVSMVNSRCCYTFDTDKIRLFNKKNSWHVITGLTLFFWFYPVLQAENQLLSQEVGIVLYANPHITKLTNTLFDQISSLKNMQWQTFWFECPV